MSTQTEQSNALAKSLKTHSAFAADTELPTMLRKLELKRLATVQICNTILPVTFRLSNYTSCKLVWQESFYTFCSKRSFIHIAFALTL